MKGESIMAANKSVQYHIETKVGKVKVYAKKIDNKSIEFTIQRKKGYRPIPISVRAVVTESKFMGKVKKGITLVCPKVMMMQTEFNQLKEIADEMLTFHNPEVNDMWNALLKGDYRQLNAM
jgi:hypothetical protein